MLAQNYIAAAIKKETQRLIFIDKSGGVSAEARHGDEIWFKYKEPYSCAYPKIGESVKISRLPPSATLPDMKIESFNTGRPEEFKAALGFTSPETSPSRPTVALWTAVKKRSFSAFELVFSGPDLNVSFEMSKWLGCFEVPSAAPETVVSLRQPGTGLIFKRNCHTTGWVDITEE